MDAVRPKSCERARQWASQRVDGELSELEAARLDRHTARCASCAAFAHAMSEVAGTLRSAPLARLTRPVPDAAPPRQRRRLLRPLSLAGTAAVGLAAMLALVVPPPRVVREPSLTPDNGRSEIDAVRLRAAMGRLAPGPAWPGHGGTT